MRLVKDQLGEFGGVYVDAQGHAGGLALLWDKLTTISFLSSSTDHIDDKVIWRNRDEEWHFTGIYGWSEAQFKLRTDLKTHSALPWLSKGEVVEEQLDRYCTSSDWSALFLEATVSNIDCDISDHLPIFMKCCPRSAKASSSQKLFRFENMWATSQDCEAKVRACEAELVKWSKAEFGKVVDEIKKLEVYATNLMLLAEGRFMGRLGSDGAKRRYSGGKGLGRTTSGTVILILGGSIGGRLCIEQLIL
ncbi:LOW QUALITY PROTEIN: hypothetical protein Cgig2_022826 [Carnegiea gigantea]|uniref:Endonuclease/exonuclease/phosphatase domain-containing protein n=1 Tax=Carnegiea gigantea TaxID=171969 RepID=A0A9Q1KPM1_9CARY|nr:LOW QUALITY PROTEIN: hypothetical protein Cgig2_022826 [Carnegiea gigantea]